MRTPWQTLRDYRIDLGPVEHALAMAAALFPAELANGVLTSHEPLVPTSWDLAHGLSGPLPEAFRVAAVTGALLGWLTSRARKNRGKSILGDASLAGAAAAALLYVWLAVVSSVGDARVPDLHTFWLPFFLTHALALGLAARFRGRLYEGVLFAAPLLVPQIGMSLSGRVGFVPTWGEPARFGVLALLLPVAEVLVARGFEGLGIHARETAPDPLARSKPAPDPVAEPAPEAPTRPEVARLLRALGAIAFVLALGALAVRLVVFAPGRVRARELASALEGLRTADPQTNDLERAAEKLLDFDEPEAVVAILEHVDLGTTAFDIARHGVELFAASPQASDPRVRAALAAILKDEKRGKRARVNAAYLLEELDAPSLPREPEGFASRDSVSVEPGLLQEAAQPIVAASTFSIDFGPAAQELAYVRGHGRPWRMLVRLTQSLLYGRDGKIVVAGKRVILEAAPAPAFYETPETTDFGVAFSALGKKARDEDAFRLVLPHGSKDAADWPLPDAKDPEKRLRALARALSFSCEKKAERTLVAKPR